VTVSSQARLSFFAATPMARMTTPPPKTTRACRRRAHQHEGAQARDTLGSEQPPVSHGAVCGGTSAPLVGMLAVAQSARVEFRSVQPATVKASLACPKRSPMMIHCCSGERTAGVRRALRARDRVSGNYPLAAQSAIEGGRL
jgi:hypothetical protein